MFENLTDEQRKELQELKDLCNRVNGKYAHVRRKSRPHESRISSNTRTSCQTMSDYYKKVMH